MAKFSQTKFGKLFFVLIERNHTVRVFDCSNWDVVQIHIHFPIHRSHVIGNITSQQLLHVVVSDGITIFANHTSRFLGDGGRRPFVNNRRHGVCWRVCTGELQSTNEEE